MSEELNVNEQEVKAPSKEEMIAFMQEQIEVKKVQLELQELNTKLAVHRAEEIKALGLIAQMTNPRPPADAVPHIVTQEDMDQNPELAEQGFKVGDEVLVAKETAEQIAQAEKAERKLKK